MNVAEAYIKFKGQLVILISGLSGSGITTLGKSISRDFKIPLINTKEFCKKDYNEKIVLQSNNREITNWYSDDIYDWEGINKKYTETVKSKKCVVLVGTVLPDDKLSSSITPDMHLHIKLTKQNILKKREKYNVKHNIKPDVDEHLIFNTLEYPYYLDTLKKTKISKFINANELVELEQKKYDDKIYDEAFDYIIFQITKYLNSPEKGVAPPIAHKAEKSVDKITEKPVVDTVKTEEETEETEETEEAEETEETEEAEEEEELSSLSEDFNLSTSSVHDSTPWIWRPIGPRGVSYRAPDIDSYRDKTVT